MKPYFEEQFGNASSIYRFVGEATKESREIVDNFLGQMEIVVLDL